jgi:hypothetical protein
MAAAPATPPFRPGLIGTGLAVGTLRRPASRGIDHGCRAEFVDFADAVRFGVRPVGRVARSAAGAMVFQRPVDYA